MDGDCPDISKSMGICRWLRNQFFGLLGEKFRLFIKFDDVFAISSWCLLSHCTQQLMFMIHSRLQVEVEYFVIICFLNSLVNLDILALTSDMFKGVVDLFNKKGYNEMMAQERVSKICKRLIADGNFERGFEEEWKFSVSTRAHGMKPPTLKPFEFTRNLCNLRTRKTWHVNFWWQLSNTAKMVSVTSLQY